MERDATCFASMHIECQRPIVIDMFVIFIIVSNCMLLIQLNIEKRTEIDVY
jgi:hypothetical protein